MFKHLAVLFLALATPAAQAYELSDTTWRWQGRPLSEPIYVNLDTFPDWLGTPDQIEAEVMEAVAVFDGVTRLQLTYGGDTDLGATQNDGQITIVFTELENPTIVGGSTVISGVGDNHAAECDIRIYNVGYVVDETMYGRQLSHAIAHEIGHCLGLHHSADPNALMYPSIPAATGPTLLEPDDIAGLRILYGNCYDDADGDGVLDCDDCDDGDASVNPYVVEFCDGVDNDCDGAVDELGAIEEVFGAPDQLQSRSYGSAGNFYTVDEPTQLEAFEHHAEIDEPMDVSWSVVEWDPDDGTTTVLFSETQLADPGVGWWTSPPIDLVLQPGRTYWIAFGGSEDVVHRRAIRPEPPAGATPRIATWGHDSQYRFPYYYDEPANLTEYADYSYHQTLWTTPLEDVDGNGVADVCGACPPDAVDSDGDGLADCEDPCPGEAGDPDGDGVCAVVDVCPDDWDSQQLDTDGDGIGNVCDPTPNGDPQPPSTNDGDSGGCTLLGCGGNARSLLGSSFMVFGLVGMRRRESR